MGQRLSIAPSTLPPDKDDTPRMNLPCEGTWNRSQSDRNDAVGIARIMQCGWYKEVRVKDLDSHAIKALLVSRALLVKIKRDLENSDPRASQEPRARHRPGKDERVCRACRGADRG